MHIKNIKELLEIKNKLSKKDFNFISKFINIKKNNNLYIYLTLGKNYNLKILCFTTKKDLETYGKICNWKFISLREFLNA